MNNNKRLILYVFGLLLVTSFHSVMIGMIPSSSRRMLAPAMQSGFRYIGSQAGGVNGSSNILNSNFSKQGYGLPAFSPMPMQPVKYSANVAGSSSQALQPLLAGSQSGQSSGSGNRAGFWAGIFGAGAVAATMNNIAYAQAQEEPVDISGLLNLDRDLDSVDAILYPDLAQFIKKYSCSFDLGKRSEFVHATKNYFKDLDNKQIQSYQNSKMYQHAGFFNRDNEGRHQFSAVSGNLVPVANETQFFIKGSEIDRVINAERLKSYLKRKGFGNFKVASECLHYTGQSVEILSPLIKLGNQDTKISLDEVKQILQIAQDTGYSDWQFGKNLMRDYLGHLVFVDTEDISFICGKEILLSIPRVDETRRSKINKMVQLFMGYQDAMNDEAKNWLQEQLDQYGVLEFLKGPVENESLNLFVQRAFAKRDQLNKELGLIEHLLPEDSRYDRSSNFEKVKEQFERYQQEQRLAKEQKESKNQAGVLDQTSLEEID
jgi:hypothetical protein